MNVCFFLSFKKIEISHYSNHKIVRVRVTFQIVYFRLLYVAQVADSEDAVFDGTV